MLKEQKIIGTEKANIKADGKTIVLSISLEGLNIKQKRIILGYMTQAIEAIKN